MKKFREINFLISETNDFDCEGQLGPVANPEDCSSFYLCDFEEATLQYCHESELFDETLLVCNYEYLVDCGTRPKPGGSTTSTNPSESKMIHFPKLARLRRPPAAFLLNRAITRGASGFTFFTQP